MAASLQFIEPEPDRCAEGARCGGPAQPRQPSSLAFAFAASVFVAGCAGTPRAQDEERVELLALLQTLNADLLSHPSATLTLERWCADHRLATPARVVARRVHDTDKPLPADLRERLALGAGERVGYRHVRLSCGDRVLSEADNWYVPDRLTADMNRRLDTTDEPFGKVVAPLHFQRRTLSARLLWSPLPAGWEMPENAAPRTSGSPLHIPHRLLQHEAILYTAAQLPISAVVETYTDQVFAFDGWPDRFEK